MIGCAVLCLAAGGVGSVFTRHKIPGWYKGLRKPSFNPPNWIFGPVWTLLYLLMGAALYRVWSLHDYVAGRNTALGFFFIQLFLNAFWSYVFFGMQALWLAFRELVALWVFIALTIMQFQRLDAASAWLLAPYLAWVTFAGLLNYAIARLNPES